mgnify:CR=1 FL=1
MPYAGVAQLAERQLPKLKAVGSRPITRSFRSLLCKGGFFNVVLLFKREVI